MATKQQGYKADIRSIPVALARAQGFASKKSFASLEIDRLVTLSLLQTFVFFQLIPCQSTYCHDFTSGTFLPNYSCQAYTIDHRHELPYAREFLRAAKEAMQRSFPCQRTVSLAGKRAGILQYIVSVTFQNSNYFYKEVCAHSDQCKRSRKSHLSTRK